MCLFVGPIPESIGDLVQLQRLYLDANQFSGGCYFIFIIRFLTITDDKSTYRLNSLYIITLVTNYAGEIPDSIGKLVNLERLGLSKNMLSGMVPSSITKLTSIMRLNIDNNLITG